MRRGSNARASQGEEKTNEPHPYGKHWHVRIINVRNRCSDLRIRAIFLLKCIEIEFHPADRSIGGGGLERRLTHFIDSLSRSGSTVDRSDNAVDACRFSGSRAPRYLTSRRSWELEVDKPVVADMVVVKPPSLRRRKPSSSEKE